MGFKKWIGFYLTALFIIGAVVQPARAAVIDEPVLLIPQGEVDTRPLTPDPGEAPEMNNPLTGIPAAQQEYLKNPAVLVSTSNFPGATRPQSGISFADQIYEFWIGVGMTRFLPVFYGNYPQVRPALIGDCLPRREVFNPTGPFLGNRVWYDEDGDGIQDTSERGVPGVCVSLINAQSGKQLAATTSDSNGYYGFELPEGVPVNVQFKLPPSTIFSPTGKAPANLDSDVNPQTGKSGVIYNGMTDLNLDAGIRWDETMPVVPKVGEGARIERSIWMDVNRNGLLDEDESGLAGVQVNLYDADTDALLAVTRTDTKGVFAFEIDGQKMYYLRVLPDLGSFFTRPDEEDIAEDAINDYEDPITGKSPIFNAQSWDSLAWNVGLKEAQAGPLRSGRIVFQTISRYYNGSRLFYASKHESVAIGGSGNVYGEDPNNISSAFLGADRMLEASHSAAADPATVAAGLHYASNEFSSVPPQGGTDARTVNYFVNVLNFSQWRYDPLAENYLRFDDHSDGRGMLYPSLDRMTGRQIGFSNVVVVFTEHKQIEGLKIEMGITPNLQNKAMLFRDGKAYPVLWSSLNEEYEKTTQRLRPPRILDTEGNRFPLKPGPTWFIMVTTRTTIEDQGDGIWKVRFFEPPLVGNFQK